MDDLEKIAIRLRHWIGHNLEHVKSYEEVAAKLLDLGLNDASNNIHKAVEFGSKTNQKFEAALSLIESKAGKLSECSERRETGHSSAHGPHTHTHDDQDMAHHKHS